jgi:hypothetical protein
LDGERGDIGECDGSTKWCCGDSQEVDRVAASNFHLKLISGFNALLIFQAKTDWEGNFEIVKRNEEKEAEEEEDEKRNESKKDGKCVKRKSVHEY